MSGLQQVHVRVTDAATGRPTPCRVRFTDAQGKYYAPHGRLTEFATGFNVDVGGNVMTNTFVPEEGLAPAARAFAYIDGGCEIALPPGPLSVTICKGPEYVPVHETIDLPAGKLALRFVLGRWSDLRQTGWYPGDARAHFLSPAAALLEGEAEDLAVVNMLACIIPLEDEHKPGEKGTIRADYPILLDFSGQQPALQSPRCMVVVNTQNKHPVLGYLGLLNCHRIVHPLGFGWPAPGKAWDNWTLADWCDHCHRKRWTCSCIIATRHFTAFFVLFDMLVNVLDHALEKQHIATALSR